ncbi:hypothetical protein XhyaCFBP1156_10960 [Xanthomonas hyacinthi]|uniref:Uncharacterized protein n=1 Tax=Xanthomonas hyacinthi TaxID=56455 RepID=A0A2S7EWG0_9XANT|nr:hypothetical protein Y886_20690 [Xanthomonas hyacinthi DSM 19077]PPU97499.1 hypothetical protein XhyaCFBP1156_10960 [Xanthomonas hyacinthi]
MGERAAPRPPAGSFSHSATQRRAQVDRPRRQRWRSSSGRIMMQMSRYPIGAGAMRCSASAAEARVQP